MKVPIQKGKVVAAQPTMKHMTVKETDRQDAEMHKLRRSGQTLSYMSPKQ